MEVVSASPHCVEEEACVFCILHSYFLA
jgi:hypothetical protein